MCIFHLLPLFFFFRLLTATNCKSSSSYSWIVSLMLLSAHLVVLQSIRIFHLFSVLLIFGKLLLTNRKTASLVRIHCLSRNRKKTLKTIYKEEDFLCLPSVVDYIDQFADPAGGLEQILAV